jgi:soluble lytic murein transglycosylase-like protein
MDVATLLLAFTAATQTHQLPPGLLSALCYVESRHNVRAINIHDGGSSSHGVCQVKLGTARQMGFRGTAKELQSPKNNIRYAARYLHYQYLRYDGNAHKAIAAYNSGTYSTVNGRAKNSKYVTKVFIAWSERR